MKEHLIINVIKNSPADKAGIKKGDRLISLNDKSISDIFDYDFIAEDEEVLVGIIDSNGAVKNYHITKGEDEDLGLVFPESLMDNYKSCYNNCIFCFIDQNPPGMRETIYFKDDDSRLSFLQGNYITMTNMKDEEIDRIIKYRLAPINISVHATNPELRIKMLHNRFAGNILQHIEKLYAADIPMNAQIVLCKGINDGDELRRSLGDLSRFAPVMGSVSVVPVGLTKFREGLPCLKKFNGEDAKEVIDIVEKVQEEVYGKCGIHFAHASDEWYIMAGRSMPDADNYDGYNQIENGVGMTRLLIDEFSYAVGEVLQFRNDRRRHRPRVFLGRTEKVYDDILRKNKGRTVSTFCGTLSSGNESFIRSELKKIRPDIKLNVFTVKNDFFGHDITVTGLLTGQDIVNELKGKELGDALLVPSSCLKAGENIFLDDMTVTELGRALQVKTIIVKSYGMDYLKDIVGV